MFRGERINFTENRAVLHTALRAPRESSVMVDGENVISKIHAVLDRMAAFSTRVRSGDWKGHTGKPIRRVINIGFLILSPAVPDDAECLRTCMPEVRLWVPVDDPTLLVTAVAPSGSGDPMVVTWDRGSAIGWLFTHCFHL